MAREEIDSQLPYIQVHRSVGAKAAQLAPVLGITYQHARGAMEVFWEMLADRRILNAALRRPDPAIVLEPSDCRTRLKFAFGIDVDPNFLVMAGFLEPADEGYRVRGMSRYLAAESGRLSKKNKRKDSGEHSSEDPVSSGSHCKMAGVQPGSDRGETKDEPECDPAKARGKRREEIDEKHHPPVSLPEQQTEASNAIVGEDDAFWKWAQEERVKSGLTRETNRPRSFAPTVNAAHVEVGPRALSFAYCRFLLDQDFRGSGWPMAVFLRPMVWRPRAHLRPEGERESLTGVVIQKKDIP